MSLLKQLFFKSDPSGLEFKGVMSIYFSRCMICNIYNSTCYLFEKKNREYFYINIIDIYFIYSNTIKLLFKEKNLSFNSFHF